MDNIKNQLNNIISIFDNKEDIEFTLNNIINIIKKENIKNPFEQALINHLNKNFKKFKISIIKKEDFIDCLKNYSHFLLSVPLNKKDREIKVLVKNSDESDYLNFFCIKLDLLKNKNWKNNDKLLILNFKSNADLEPIFIKIIDNFLCSWNKFSKTDINKELILPIYSYNEENETFSVIIDLNKIISFIPFSCNFEELIDIYLLDDELYLQSEVLFQNNSEINDNIIFNNDSLINLFINRFYSSFELNTNIDFNLSKNNELSWFNVNKLFLQISVKEGFNFEQYQDFIKELDKNLFINSIFELIFKNEDSLFNFIEFQELLKYDIQSVSLNFKYKNVVNFEIRSKIKNLINIASSYKNNK